MTHYKDWQILESMPEGWIIDKLSDSPLPCSVFITNGKSPLAGQQRAILKVSSKPNVFVPNRDFIPSKVNNEVIDNVPFPAKTVNTLARKTFQMQLLKDIQCDMMVCELEGWDKKEYIKELKDLINRLLP